MRILNLPRWNLTKRSSFRTSDDGRQSRDGTSPHTVEFARMKAYTARTRNQTSQEFAAATASGDSMVLRQIPGVIAIGGGVPIRMGSETIGAVGVSGAPGGDKDEVCARAGIARVASALN